MKQLILIISGVVLTYLLILRLGVSSIKDHQDYKKLFSPSQNSMIIGTSRAAKLNASIMSKELRNQISKSGILNYAFNLGMSPYGTLYNESIFSHVNFMSKENGFFFVCIDPWALSEKKDLINQPKKFRETRTSINFNREQNLASIKYFLENYSKPYYNLFLPSKKQYQKRIKRPDKDFIKNHLIAKINRYKRVHFFDQEISKVRLNSLKFLINELSKKGKVYLVKLPISNEMISLEKKFCPDFDSLITSHLAIPEMNLIDFYPYSNLFLYPDGNHLWQEDADKVSQIIADIVRLNEKRLLTNDKTNLISTYLENEQAKYATYFNKKFAKIQ